MYNSRCTKCTSQNVVVSSNLHRSRNFLGQLPNFQSEVISRNMGILQSSECPCEKDDQPAGQPDNVASYQGLLPPLLLQAFPVSPPAPVYAPASEVLIETLSETGTVLEINCHAGLTTSTEQIASRLSTYPCVQHVSVGGPDDVVEKILDCLDRLPQLTTLSVSGSVLTLPDALARLHRLECLKIWAAWVKKCEVAFQIPTLQVLEFPDGCDFSSWPNRHVVGLPHLRELRLGNPNCDIGMFDFTPARRLETLIIKSCGPGERVRECPALPSLKHVVFQDAKLGKFEDMSALQQLQTLVFYRCNPPGEMWRHTLISVKTLLLFEVPLPENLDLRTVFPGLQFAAIYGIPPKAVFYRRRSSDLEVQSMLQFGPTLSDEHPGSPRGATILQSLTLPDRLQTLMVSQVDLSLIDPAVLTRGGLRVSLLECNVTASVSNFRRKMFRLPENVSPMVRYIEPLVDMPRSWD